MDNAETQYVSLMEQVKTLLTNLQTPQDNAVALDVETPISLDAVGGVGALATFSLWVSFACMFLSTVYFLCRAMSRKPADRTFEFITGMITCIASLAYLTMASGGGVMENGTLQPFYYARYVDWILTTPLMVWDLLELAGTPGQTIFMVCCIDVLMIACGIIGSMLIDSPVRWIFFILGCVFFLFLVNELNQAMASSPYGNSAQAVMVAATRLTIVSWAAYPVVWGLTEGSNIVGVDVACLLYAILDVVSKCVFGVLIVSNRGALDEIYNRKEGYKAVSTN